MGNMVSSILALKTTTWKKHMALRFTFYSSKQVTEEKEIQSICLPGRTGEAEHTLIFSTVVLSVQPNIWLSLLFMCKIHYSHPKENNFKKAHEVMTPNAKSKVSSEVL